METVAVFDTEPVAIEGLRSLLQPEDGLRVVAGSGSLENAYDSIRDLQPSITILDKGFGLHPILELLKNLRAPGVQTGLVVWGVCFTEAESLRLLQAGVSGVVRKTAALQLLVQCLRTVGAGATWMEEGVFANPGWPARPQRSTLTARELEVVELVERGMKNRDIASILGISTGTVKIHLKHIFEKTGIRGRYGLAISGLKEKGLMAPAYDGAMSE